MEDSDLEWTEQERAEFATLLQPSAPPPDLEHKVTSRLLTVGLLQRNRAPVAYRSWLLAAGIALLLGGFALGRWQVPSGDTGPATRYLLLLHEDDSFRPAQAPAALRAEVSHWAAGLQRSGELIEGDRLGVHGRLLKPGGTAGGLAPDDVITGFFVLRATSDERALAIARTCPHLAFGGYVEVRRIQPDGRIGVLRP